MRVLIDRNIERNAVTHQSVETPRTVRWGDMDVTVNVLERQYFPPRDDERRRIAELSYLATIGAAARAGKLQLYSSFELAMERARQRGKDPGYVGRSLLEGVAITRVPLPAHRSVVFGDPGRDPGRTRDEQIVFFKRVRDSRFLKLRAAVGEAHIADVFHFWTAESAGLDAFLTMDFAFLNAARGQEAISASRVTLAAPSDLCALIGEGPADTIA